MLRLKSLRPQRGDTILEVLIATAVLTLVLTIAYTAANRGSQSVRQAQERGESSHYTETQIELLKTFLSKISDPSLPGIPTSGNFCMVNNGTTITAVPITGAIAVNAQNETFSAFTPASLAECKKDNLYYSYIERNGNTFIAHTRWTKVNGKGIDEATMVHRIFPDQASGPLSLVTVSPGCAADFFYNVVLGCTPCPSGYTSPGGYSAACAPIPAQVRVVVQKIPPDPPGNVSPACSKAGVDSTGVAVRLTGPGGPFNGTSTALLDVGFSSTYNASITTMPNGFTQCATPSSATSTPIGTPPTPPPGNNQRTITLKIKPVCTTVITTDHWGLENDPATYYADQTGWNSYWVRGAHLASLSTYGVTATYGTGEFVLADARSPSGYTWFAWFDYSDIYDGYSYYNGWVATWQSDPVYGDPYYHGTIWVNHPTTSLGCES